MNLSKRLEKSKRIAIEAGNAIMNIYNQREYLQIEYKLDDTPLTIADKISNRIIVDTLRKEIPDCAILSEEERADQSRLFCADCFVIDPLDGTKEFIKRNGQFTVNIALSHNHKSVMGVIYVPVTGELYYAAEGMGSFLRQSDGNIKKLQVSSRQNKDTLRAVMSSSHGCEEMDKLIEKYHIGNFVKMGSSLKGCVVARGDAEIYYRYNPTMEWDTAAMQCIVEEAGGIFRQMDDTPMTYNRENSVNEKGFYIVNCEENRLR